MAEPTTLTLRGCADAEGALHAVGPLRHLDFLLHRNQLPLNLCDIESLTELRLDNCPDLVSLPVRLPALRHLQELTIRGCPLLTALPDSLCYLPQLQNLYVGECAVAALPQQLGLLQTLQCISLVHLPALTALPESLTALANLHTLCVVDCRALTTLPDDWRRLRSLQALTLKGVGITEWPLTLATLYDRHCVLESYAQ